jgi:hypothetical protein
MEQPLTAIYDANILYPAPIRDLFIRLAQAGLVRAKWTETIHDEWMGNLLKDNPRLSPERLERTRTLMNEAIRDCLVAGYEDRCKWCSHEFSGSRPHMRRSPDSKPRVNGLTPSKS